MLTFAYSLIFWLAPLPLIVRWLVPPRAQAQPAVRVPFLVRLGMFVSPVGFMSSLVPERWRMLYHLNPMVGVIDGFRWCILGAEFEPWWPGFAVGAAVVATLLVSGAYFFRSTERTFAPE